MASVLQQTLRGLCYDTGWCYAVFWKLKRQLRTVLTWEDAFYERSQEVPKLNSNPAAMNIPVSLGAFGQQMSGGLADFEDPIGLSVAKMSYHVYSVGEGIIGRVMFTNKHQWVFSTSDKVTTAAGVPNSKRNTRTQPDKYPAGWEHQFAAGIKTIAVIAVPQGVVQLGSTQMVAEDLKLVGHAKALFGTLQNVPGAFLSDLVSEVQRGGLHTLYPVAVPTPQMPSRDLSSMNVEAPTLLRTPSMPAVMSSIATTGIAAFGSNLGPSGVGRLRMLLASQQLHPHSQSMPFPEVLGLQGSVLQSHHSLLRKAGSDSLSQSFSVVKSSNTRAGPVDTVPAKVDPPPRTGISRLSLTTKSPWMAAPVSMVPEKPNPAPRTGMIGGLSLTTKSSCMAVPVSTVSEKPNPPPQTGIIGHFSLTTKSSCTAVPVSIISTISEKSNPPPQTSPIGGFPLNTKSSSTGGSSTNTSFLGTANLPRIPGQSTPVSRAESPQLGGGGRSSVESPQLGGGGRSSVESPQLVGGRSLVKSAQLVGIRASVESPQCVGIRASGESPQRVAGRSSVESPLIVGIRASIESPRHVGRRPSQLVDARSSVEIPQLVGGRFSVESPKPVCGRSPVQSPQLVGGRPSVESPHLVPSVESGGRPSVESPQHFNSRTSVESPQLVCSRYSIESPQVVSDKSSLESPQLVRSISSISCSSDKSLDKTRNLSGCVPLHSERNTHLFVNIDSCKRAPLLFDGGASTLPPERWQSLGVSKLNNYISVVKSRRDDRHDHSQVRDLERRNGAPYIRVMPSQSPPTTNLVSEVNMSARNDMNNAPDSHFDVQISDLLQLAEQFANADNYGLNDLSSGIDQRSSSNLLCEDYFEDMQSLFEDSELSVRDLWAAGDCVENLFNTELDDFDNFLASLTREEDKESDMFSELGAGFTSMGALISNVNVGSLATEDVGVFAKREKDHANELRGSNAASGHVNVAQAKPEPHLPTLSNDRVASKWPAIDETLFCKEVATDRLMKTRTMKAVSFPCLRHTDGDAEMGCQEAAVLPASRQDATVRKGRKRSRPGEAGRPRPKDRQQIQDHVRELRDIIPNAAKCGIDTLLEKTVEYMNLLQTVSHDTSKWTQRSKLQNDDCGNGIGHGPDGTTVDASWAVELGGQGRGCPIIVENLNKTRQMLVEMLCEEKGIFLEIADSIRRLGLTILKGVVEARDDKIWARFVVEAVQDVHRVQVLWSLMQLLEQNTRCLSDVTNPPCDLKRIH